MSRTLYLPALGYSDDTLEDDALVNKWLTLRLYERVGTAYRHGGHLGAWHRRQVTRVGSEVRWYHYGLCSFYSVLPPDTEVILLMLCPNCNTVNEFHVLRSSYALQCKGGCGELYDIDELLGETMLRDSISAIDSKLSARMLELATAQGYTVEAGY